MDSYPECINVYEHGILLEKGDDSEALNLIATTTLPIYAHFNLAIVGYDRRSLNERAVGLADTDGPHSPKDYYEEYDLRYCVLSSLYHLNRLIDIYVKNAQLFERRFPEKTTVRGNLHDPNIFYEVDAFLTAARRVYDAIPKILWKHYYPDEGNRWDSIRKMFKKMDKVPQPFGDVIRESWNQIGVNLRDYRDCIIHYVPLTNGLETCWMERFDGRWGANIKLPANPETKSRKAFDFETGPEALSYCHRVAIEAVDLCEKLKNQTKLGEYLENPKSMR